MRINSSIRLLLALIILIIVLLTGYYLSQRSERQANDTNTTVEVPASEITSVAEKWNELYATYEKFDNSVEEFIANLSNQSINSAKALDNLKALSDQATPSNFIKGLKREDRNAIEEKAKGNLEQTQKILEDISIKVLNPLQKGLTETATKEVQMQLGIIEKKGIQGKELGIYGPLTKDEIKFFFEGRSDQVGQMQQLESQIHQLNQILRGAGHYEIAAISIPPPSAEGFSPKSTERLENLESRLAKLETSNAQLQNNISNLRSNGPSKTVWLILLFGILLFVLLQNLPKLVSLSRKLSEPRRDERELTSSSARRIQQPNYVNSDDINHIYSILPELVRRHVKDDPTILSILEARLWLKLEAKLKQQIIQQKTEPQSSSTSDNHVQSFPPLKSSVPKGRSSTQKFPNASFSAQTSKPASTSLEWVQAYNRDSLAFSRARPVIEVSETKKSIEDRRLGLSQPVVLERTGRRGNYWIVEEQGLSSLVPSTSLRINEYNYEAIQTLFECHGYQPANSDRFLLLQPARVSPIASGQAWQLDAVGVLQFEPYSRY